MDGYEWGRSVGPQNRHEPVANLSRVGLSYLYMSPEGAAWRVRRNGSVLQRDSER